MGAEHATAEKVNAPQELQAQEAPAEEQATTDEARVLALQRMAGNRAVTSLLRGSGHVVQRDITVRIAALNAGRSWKDRVRTSFAADTYSQIIEAVHDYRRTRDPRRKLYLARVIEWRTDDWLQRHGDRESSKERKQKALIEELNAQAKREVGNLRAQVVYMKDLTSNASLLEGGQGMFQGLLPQAQKSGVYTNTARGLAAGGAPGGRGGDRAAAEVVAKYKLTAAEIAAIRTYTSPDYAYINPAAENNDAWLKSNAEGQEHIAGMAGEGGFQTHDPRLNRSVEEFGTDTLTPGLKLLKQEGALHAGMLQQALMKLPRYDKIAYRGRRMSDADFDEQYLKRPGQPEVMKTFTSSSKSESIAKGYADGTGGDVRPAAHKTVSVLYEMTMKDGRDISMLSAAMTLNPEQEVLILPGAVFRVTQVIEYFAGAVGKPTATRWFRIKLTQLR